MSSQIFTASQNASYLQTCDINSGHQLSSQALTRTKITTLNMGPESNSIEEPDVTHMNTSYDGLWLATIDEWTPPKRDFAPLTFDEVATAKEQIARQEIYLKFWSWNSIDQVWELVSRVDNPHASDSGNPYDSGRILGLASDPIRAAFSTVGEDGIVKTWMPTVRTRRGLKVKGKDGSSLTTWRCQHTISTGMPGSSVSGLRSAKLAYSHDGSLLAVAPAAASSTSPIYLVDTETGVIQNVRASLSSGPMFGIGIIAKYLIILSHELIIWDLVSNVFFYGIDLHTQSLPSKLQSTSLLAVDHRHNTFAIAILSANKEGRLRTKLAVFDPSNPEPLFNTTVPTTITNLLPAIGKKGFYTIDSHAEIRSLAAQQPVLTGLPSPPRDKDHSSRGLDGLFGDGKKAIEQENSASKQTKALLNTTAFDRFTASEPRKEDGDAVVVSRDRLAEVFDTGSALAMPPITELFQRVARLYDGQIQA